MAKKRNGNSNGKKPATQQSVDQAVKSICDIMRRGTAICVGIDVDIVFADSRRAQEHEKEHSKAVGIAFRPSLDIIEQKGKEITEILETLRAS